MFTKVLTTMFALSVLAGAGLVSPALSEPASAAVTWHVVTAASKVNDSSAVERPTWNLACNSRTQAWRFSINDVQVIDASGQPWNQNGSTTGPWSITVWSAPGAGPIPFSQTLTLTQNATNGLFSATGAGTSSSAQPWCVPGGSVTVVGFSGTSEPLLLDGTLG